MTDTSSTQFEAIGTVWIIHLSSELNKHNYADIINKAKSRISKFDEYYSRFKPNSLVTKMSQKGGYYKLPEDAKPMLDLYEMLYSLSGNQMTPLIGQMLEDAGYDANYTLKPSTLRSIPEWHEALVYDYPMLKIKIPVLLDFGAIGKGCIIDLVADIFKQEGVSQFSINAGGDIYNYQVGYDYSEVLLESPLDTSLAIGTADVSNKAICASAGNRRAWHQYNHIINPISKQSPTHIMATWVIADSAMLADGLSTALYFASPEILSAKFNFDYLIINKDLTIDCSSGFPVSFFTESNNSQDSQCSK